eukprot:3627142-Pyramimonas_sp.AAC.1
MGLGLLRRGRPRLPGGFCGGQTGLFGGPMEASWDYLGRLTERNPERDQSRITTFGLPCYILWKDPGKACPR